MLCREQTGPRMKANRYQSETTAVDSKRSVWLRPSTEVLEMVGIGRILGLI